MVIEKKRNLRRKNIKKLIDRGSSFRLITGTLIAVCFQLFLREIEDKVILINVKHIFFILMY